MLVTLSIGRLIAVAPAFSLHLTPAIPVVELITSVKSL